MVSFGKPLYRILIALYIYQNCTTNKMHRNTCTTWISTIRNSYDSQYPKTVEYSHVNNIIIICEASEVVALNTRGRAFGWFHSGLGWSCRAWKLRCSSSLTTRQTSRVAFGYQHFFFYNSSSARIILSLIILRNRQPKWVPNRYSCTTVQVMSAFLKMFSKSNLT